MEDSAVSLKVDTQKFKQIADPPPNYRIYEWARNLCAHSKTWVCIH